MEYERLLLINEINRINKIIFNAKPKDSKLFKHKSLKWLRNEVKYLKNNYKKELTI